MDSETYLVEAEKAALKCLSNQKPTPKPQFYKLTTSPPKKTTPLSMISSTLSISTDDVAAHYNQLDQFYRDYWGEHVHHGLWENGDEPPELATERLIDRVASVLDLQAGQNICDIGCGYGGASRYLTQKFEINATGVTLSEEQAKEAARIAKNLQKSPQILVKNWLENNFTDECFDAVFSIECLAHVTDKARYFEQLHRVLKPGKKASITAWMIGDNVTPQQKKDLIIPICNEGRLPGMGSETDYREMIEATGLRVVQFQDLTRKVEETWAICIRRTIKGFFTDPKMWKYVLGKNRSELVFALTLRRIQKAYQCGAMRYGWFEIEKPL